MTTSYYAERANLSRLQHLHPQWSHQQLADSLGRSREWVKKWRKRFREEVAADIPLEQVLQGHSRARIHPPVKIPIPVVQAILRIRDAPPEGLRRVPGPKAIAYYLGREAEQAPEPLPVPSCRTIYRILTAHQRIAQRQPRVRQPLERPAPLSSWQLDFKDVSTVPADPFGKQQQVVETLNVLDVGTSILLDAQVREDFTAETALAAVARTLQTHGMPQQLTLDRDTRWVGSPHGSDFPSALVRFCACLGIHTQVCDPHHPQQNAFVERYHRTYQHECLALDRPTSLEQARQVTEAFTQHYNVERPNQALSCGNQPPHTAFPSLPNLPPLPQLVDPDHWLHALDGLHLERKVNRHGQVSVDLKLYYVSSRLAGQRVVLHLDATHRCLHVLQEEQPLKSVPLKGLLGHLLTFEQFLALMLQQARAQQRLRSLQERRFRRGLADSP
jgi:transposase InsO family protein